ncbi:MAG: methyltransferase domain-containing protein [Bacilli bacterium]|nr:methyltransferase domain-containing protein [Bacilli bacterium]
MILADLVRVSNDILKGKTKSLEQERISENNLLAISEFLKRNPQFEVSNLVNIILHNEINEVCDWNIGSLLQHFDYNEIIDVLSNIKPSMRGYLYDSIGFCWALGECPYKNEQVIEFLYEVINNGRNPESWWRASFALEKITGKNAINNLKRSMKNSESLSLKESLQDLTNKRNIINILLKSNSKDIKETIYPYLKRRFDISRDEKELINIIWLLGRLRLYDSEMVNKSLSLLENSQNYELKYYILQAMVEDPKILYLDYFEKFLHSEDMLIKKMAISGIGDFGNNNYVSKLNKMLERETDPKIISALTTAIYKIENNYFNENRNYIKKYMVNENGLIGDDTDKWYADASIYNLFSEAEDPQNICFNLIFKRILAKKLKIINPIDMATGTGRAAKYILNNIGYEGTLYAVDYSQQMLDYFERTINRQKYYVKNIDLVHSKIEDFRIPNNAKSSFIISSFGFPSKISDKKRCRDELQNVYNLLSEDGVFVTLGWDETFNDELNNMWYKYIPDNIKASNFEEWRKNREESITSPRNCDLSWYKTNLKVPLLYDTLEETINVMGHLFGRDAALEILKSRKRMWWMSLGITWNDKKSISKILKNNK